MVAVALLPPGRDSFSAAPAALLTASG